jgi:hypothetical protein
VRKWRNVDQIKALQRQFQRVADDLGAVADAMVKGGLPEILCHSESMFNRRIQEAVNFSCRLRSEVEEQVVALENDRQSHAELMLDRAAREAAKAGIKRRNAAKPKIHRPAK